MKSVAGSAIGNNERAGLIRQPVITLHVGLEAIRRESEFCNDSLGGVTMGTGLDNACGCDRRSGLPRSLDPMFTVAVGADGGFDESVADRLAVDGMFIGFEHILMAPTAGRRNIEFVNFRLRVQGSMEVVGAVAVGADGGRLIAGLMGFAVNTLQIRAIGPRLDQTKLGHEFWIVVAFGAGFRDVGTVYRRIGMARIEKGVRIAVARFARSCLVDSRGDRLAMIAIEINFCFEPVTGRAFNRF